MGEVDQRRKRGPQREISMKYLEISIIWPFGDHHQRLEKCQKSLCSRFFLIFTGHWPCRASHLHGPNAQLPYGENVSTSVMTGLICPQIPGALAHTKMCPVISNSSVIFINLACNRKQRGSRVLPYKWLGLPGQCCPCLSCTTLLPLNAHKERLHNIKMQWIQVRYHDNFILIMKIVFKNMKCHYHWTEHTPFQEIGDPSYNFTSHITAQWEQHTALNGWRMIETDIS